MGGCSTRQSWTLPTSSTRRSHWTVSPLALSANGLPLDKIRTPMMCSLSSGPGRGSYGVFDMAWNRGRWATDVGQALSLTATDFVSLFTVAIVCPRRLFSFKTTLSKAFLRPLCTLARAIVFDENAPWPAVFDATLAIFAHDCLGRIASFHHFASSSTQSRVVASSIELVLFARATVSYRHYDSA